MTTKKIFRDMMIFKLINEYDTIEEDSQEKEESEDSQNKEDTDE